MENLLLASLGQGDGAQDASARFTGKPFDPDLGAFVFPYRNYDPESACWLTSDPAGFPDGPNQHFYAPVPTSGLDPWGLITIKFAEAYGEESWRVQWVEVYTRIATSFPPSVSYHWVKTGESSRELIDSSPPILPDLPDAQWVSDATLYGETTTAITYRDMPFDPEEGSQRRAIQGETQYFKRLFSYSIPDPIE